MIFFWHQPYIMPLKVFVVYLHELSHALGALITGGNVQYLVINWDESGFTRTSGGNFLAITSSGYIGSILFGSLMLRTAIISRYEKIFSIFTGFIVLVFPLVFPQKLSNPVLIMGVSWGLFFIFSGLLSLILSRALLFLMGGLTSLYSLYDLNDFFRGDIAHTDAGIIAAHYFQDESVRMIFSYLIGILISALSVWILFEMIHNALHVSKQLIEDTRVSEEELRQMEILSSLTPESIDLIVKMHGERSKP